jgi:hypothetical protein
MSVLSYRELAARGLQHRFGETPTVERKFAVTLDDPATTTQEMINAVNIFHGSPHPEYAYLLCVEGIVTENSPDPWHAELTFRYEAPLRGTQEFDADPIARAPVWSFSTGGSQVPALTYYDGSGNSNITPLLKLSVNIVVPSITANLCADKVIDAAFRELKWSGELFVGKSKRAQRRSHANRHINNDSIARVLYQ